MFGFWRSAAKIMCFQFSQHGMRAQHTHASCSMRNEKLLPIFVMSMHGKKKVKHSRASSFMKGRCTVPCGRGKQAKTTPATMTQAIVATTRTEVQKIGPNVAQSLHAETVDISVYAHSSFHATRARIQEEPLVYEPRMVSSTYLGSS